MTLGHQIIMVNGLDIDNHDFNFGDKSAFLKKGQTELSSYVCEKVPQDESGQGSDRDGDFGILVI